MTAARVTALARRTGPVAAAALLVTCAAPTRDAETAAAIDPATDPALSAVRAYVVEVDPDTSSPGWRTSLPRPPVVAFAPDRTYVWEVATSHGPLRVRLRPDVAPAHVSNALYLTELGFYDGTRSHRAIADFMVQAGCPNGDGTGNPGYALDLATKPGVGFDRVGVLAAANAGPDTDGSQFFLTFAPCPWLNGGYTIYGRVDGPESLRTLHAMEQDANPGDGAPLAPIVFEKFTVAVE